MLAKPKRRITEKRKEKSRDAARCRRSREAELYTEMSAQLPMKREDVDQLDKASIMRLAIAYLKIRDASKLLPSAMHTQPLSVKAPKILDDMSYLECMDGFVFVISNLGDIVYLSENVVDFLGVMQYELIGHSVFEFTHPCDHDELRDALRGASNGSTTNASVSMLLRFKCTLTSKGRSVNLKSPSAPYKVINVTGHLLTSNVCDRALEDKQNNNEPASKKKQSEMKKKNAKSSSNNHNPDPKISIFMAIGRPIPHPSYIETPLGNTMFLSKHSVNMQFTFVDSTILDSLEYEQGDLIGKSFYEFHHSLEARSLSHCFKGLFAKGQSETAPYRFLAKCGGYAWIQTQATVMYDRNKRPLSVVCINQVLSGVECKDEIYSISQLDWSNLKKESSKSKPKVLPQNATIIQIPETKPQIEPDPSQVEAAKLARRATPEIFAHRKKEMNKGMFLMFSDDDPDLMLFKEEPDDLSHLAPDAGGECVSLDNPSFDMFHDLILDDSYNLLPDSFDSLDSAEASFLEYRDESPLTDYTHSDFLMSPSNSKDSDNLLTPCQSPSNVDFLANVSESSQPLSFVPPPDNDLPLIGSSDLVMWGALPDHVNIHKEIRKTASPKNNPPSSSEVISASSLARLLVDAAPQIPVESADILNCIYPESSVLSVWNNDESAIPIEAVQMDLISERASKRSIQMDQNETFKRQKCEPIPTLGLVKNDNKEKPMNIQAPQSPKPTQSTSKSTPTQSNSVLMNLLVSGCDVSAGYICLVQSKPRQKIKPH